METLGIGLVGCGFAGRVFAESCRDVARARVVACCASRPERAAAFARELGIAHAARDVAELCARADVDIVAIGAPNRLHFPVALAALAAGKHLIIEKPLALSLEEGRAIAAAAARAGRRVLFAENLCFAPKYVEARRLVAGGALGEVRFVRQVEKHDGPHTPWFYDRDAAGGGALFDMGCHGIELVRWLLGKPAVTTVWAHLDTWLHRERIHPKPTELDDHAVVHMVFDGGATALVESGWSLLGGMASRLEVQGTRGVLRVSLLQEGAGIEVFREGASEPGWTTIDADWHRQNGYPQEIAHLIDCIDRGRDPEEGVHDGIAVLEVVLAAYESARTGRNVALPFRPEGVERPIDLWRPRP